MIRMCKSKRFLALVLAGVMSLSMFGCGSTKEATATTEGGAAEDNILRTAASFAYASLDVHKEYYGWYTSIYGISNIK